MTADEFDREAAARWDQIFHPDVVAAITAHQGDLDHEVLEQLDVAVRDIPCNYDGYGPGRCIIPANYAGICRTDGLVVAQVCAMHRIELERNALVSCHKCGRGGKPNTVIRWVTIFEKRSRA